MIRAEIYSSLLCPDRRCARRLLDARGVEYSLHGVDGDRARRREMMDRNGSHTVARVFIVDRPVDGFDDLRALDARGGLDPLLGL